MGLVAARDIAAKWNISLRRVAILCSEGRIAGAQRVRNVWSIPDDAEIPVDWHSLQYTNERLKPVRPFIKWAGGKGQLLAEIRNIYPDALGKSIRKYAEPFVGGGAVLFSVLSTYDLDEVYISDINSELINTYQMIRDDVSRLIGLLTAMQNAYLALGDNDRKQFYYIKRDRFNELKSYSDSTNRFERAALFIFLNRTCFNGLYRVNRKNLFNVPIGSYKKPLICDAGNLRNISELLKKVVIVCGDYRESAEFIDEHTFVYFDPPYRPLNSTSNFTAYTEQAFDDGAQIELAKYVKQVDEKGAFVVVSNSDPKNVNPNDSFFDDLYAGYKVTRVSATRMINSNADSRGRISELLISNY